MCFVTINKMSNGGAVFMYMGSMHDIHNDQTTNLGNIVTAHLQCTYYNGRLGLNYWQQMLTLYLKEDQVEFWVPRFYFVTRTAYQVLFEEDLIHATRHLHL